MHKYIALLKDNSVKFAVVLYLSLGLSAWALNGLHGTKFVIRDLTDIFVWVFAQLSIEHGIDSAFNSPKGVAPKQGGVQ